MPAPWTWLSVSASAMAMSAPPIVRHPLLRQPVLEGLAREELRDQVGAPVGLETPSSTTTHTPGCFTLLAR
ncbi:MAG: hypothetical protein IPQ09_23055 [Myxococcales bacterium]|nr:hypothetical protein [Myxococcales bacterium]